MFHENKMDTLAHVFEAVQESSGSWPWLIVCHQGTAKAWTSAIYDMFETSVLHHIVRSGVTKSLIHLDTWLDTNPEPHVIIVDEYDLQLKRVVRSMVEKLQKGGHRLFFARVLQTSPNPSPNEELDFLKK